MDRYWQTIPHWTCRECGALVYNYDLHKTFHDAVNRELSLRDRALELIQRNICQTVDEAVVRARLEVAV